MTLTDVEDKAIAQAKKENLTVEELTRKNEAVFFKDFELLKIKKPDYPVRASTAVDQAAKLILNYVEKGYAYWFTYNGAKNVYFDPLKFKGFGKLAHLDMNKWPTEETALPQRHLSRYAVEHGGFCALAWLRTKTRCMLTKRRLAMGDPHGTFKMQPS